MKKMDKNMEKMETRLLPVGSIRVAERIRKDNGGLEELANDIREHGLINPITVMEQTEGGYVLIAGLRRLKAMELLGAEEIRATVMTALEADQRRVNERLKWLPQKTQRIIADKYFNGEMPWRGEME